MLPNNEIVSLITCTLVVCSNCTRWSLVVLCRQVEDNGILCA